MPKNRDFLTKNLFEGSGDDGLHYDEATGQLIDREGNIFANDGKTVMSAAPDKYLVAARKLAKEKLAHLRPEVREIEARRLAKKNREDARQKPNEKHNG
ncbi:MAG: hypothetical protein Q8P49_00075 [Candidatus Liptonbacteria bacterium]|nr:hypothetical protein [Candidatus Liptonbacteria bacterium]